MSGERALTIAASIDVTTLSAEDLRTLLLSLAAEAKRKPTVGELWAPDDVKSYWVLLISGTNRPEQMQIARELLTWSALFTRGSSRVLCIQHSDTKAFNTCSEHFGTKEYPALYLATSPEMGTRIEVPKPALQKLQSTDGALHDFLTETHTALVQRESLAEISSRLKKDKALSVLGVLYRELRSIASLKASADISAKF